MSAVVGFVGLGVMGAPMAMHLLGSTELIVFDTQQTAGLQGLVTGGASVAAHLAELGSKCSCIILSLPDGAVVERVLFAEGGIAENARSGTLVIDCSTTPPSTSRLAAERLLELGIEFVDAPVTGERRKAEQGTLTAMVGGPRATFQRAEPLLRTFATNVVHAGPFGCGQLAKALNNCLYNISAAAMGEVLALSERLGLDPEVLARVVTSGSGQSFGFDKFAPLVFQRQFAAPEFGYPMKSAFKDMEVVSQAAIAAGVDLSPGVILAARRTYEAALDLGLGGEHKGAMAKVWERSMGVRIGDSKL